MKIIILEYLALSLLLHSADASKDNVLKQGINNRNVSSKQMSKGLSDLWPNVNNDEDLILLGEILEEIEGGRGKSHRYKKLTKTLYPLFMGVLIAKVVLIPLILKMLTVISTAALVMSKIALITTGLLALKWIFSGSDASDAKDYNHFELVYVPPKYDYAKPYRGLKFSDDQSWSDSNLISASETNKQTYIPINTVRHNELPYRYHHGSGSDVGSSSKSTQNAVATSDLYRYSRDNYYYNNNNKNNNNYNYKNNQLTDGKPFL